MDTVVTGSSRRTSMPILFAIDKHGTDIVIFRNSRLVLQTTVQLCLVVGRIIIADSHIVGHIVTPDIFSCLKIISGTCRSIGSFLKIVAKAQSVIDMSRKAFKDIPIQINASVQLLTSLFRVTAVKKSIRVISLDIFAISHNTTITAGYRIIRSHTGNSILHIAATGITGIVVCDTICITAIGEFGPVPINTSTHFHIIEHIIVIIETSIIAFKIVFHLNTLFVHHTDRNVKIRLIISTCC